MPYRSEWIEPALFCTVRFDGTVVNVWHTYKDDDYDNGPDDCWFSLYEGASDRNDPRTFDVRDFARKGEDVESERNRKMIVRRAVHSGALKYNPDEDF